MERQAAQAVPLSRQLYIQDSYQTKMILKFCVLTLLGGAIICASLYREADRDMGWGYAHALQGLRYLRGNMLYDFLFNETAVVLFLIFALIMVTLVMSHRIAGPLWRLENTARAIGRGDLTCEVRLRKTDEVKALAGQLNDMTSALRARVRDVAVTHRLLEMNVSKLRERKDTGELRPEEALEVIRDILDASKALCGKLNQTNTR